jgi:hypothetical protein
MIDTPNDKPARRPLTTLELRRIQQQQEQQRDVTKVVEEVAHKPKAWQR